MKTFSIALISVAALSLSGCMKGPQDATQMRQMAGGMLVTQSSVVVPRSPSAVNATLARGAQKCFNRTVTSTMARPGMYGAPGGYSTIAQMYRSSFRTSGGRGELTLRQTGVSGAIFTSGKDGAIAYVVDTAPVSGGTKLTMYAGRFGYQPLNDGVVGWARGGPLLCPDMPAGM